MSSILAIQPQSSIVSSSVVSSVATIEKVENKVGRPTVMTPEVVLKLEQAFAIDASVEEACSYAEIARNTFYEYLKVKPEFQDRINDLRQKPILKARQTVVKALIDPNHAFRYLEKKAKKEFGPSLDLDVEIRSKVIRLDE